MAVCSSKSNLPKRVADRHWLTLVDTVTGGVGACWLSFLDNTNCIKLQYYTDLCTDCIWNEPRGKMTGVILRQSIYIM